MASSTTVRQLVWLALAIVGALVVLPAFATGFGMMGMGPTMGGARDHGMWGASAGAPGWTVVVGVGMQLLFLALLVVAGSVGYKTLTAAGVSADPATAELRSAYARGDLDDEAFHRRRGRREAEQ